MRARFGIRDSVFGAKAAGATLRAIEAIKGIKHPFSDLAEARAALRKAAA